MNNQEQVDSRLRRYARFGRRALLVSVFIGCIWAYGRVFDWLLSAIQHRSAMDLHSDRAPLIHLLLKLGVGVILAWAAAKGLSNLLAKKPFWSEMQWRKVVVVAFCLVLYGTLSDEVKALARYYADDSLEGQLAPLALLDMGVLVLTGLIGWGLWPRGDTGRHRQSGNGKGQ